METTKLGVIGVKHIETNTVKLQEFVNLKYNTSKGGIFRCPTGTKPLTAVKVLKYRKDVLIECMYLTTGQTIVHMGTKDVVPLQLGTFEDDNEFQTIYTGEDYNETY